MKSKGFAQMIPDSMPRGSSQGERRVFDLLSRLDENHIIYYEPVLYAHHTEKRPDFIVISPVLGILIIEVKGWLINTIVGVTNDEVKIRNNQTGIVETHPHPARQAWNYKKILMTQCQNNPYAQNLLQTSGKYQGTFICPFATIVILTNINQNDLQSYANGQLLGFFNPKYTVTRNNLDEWETVGTDVLMEKLASYITPKWQFPQLTQEQVDCFRAVIHPEIILPSAFSLKAKKQTLKVLDTQQEINARSIGSGHRIVYGVAGSGKTVLLIGRAKFLAQNKDLKILILCYNVTLSSYLKSVVAEYENIDVFHFHDWIRQHKGFIVNEIETEEDEQLGEHFYQFLQNNYTGDSLYDAVLIDEAQDFAPAWFRCALMAMKEPYDGDLLVVVDGSQSLYKRRKFTWKEVNIKAQGRTISKKFNLDKSYRSSQEILSLASLFVENNNNKEVDESETAILAPPVDPGKSEKSGIKPVLIRSQSYEQECSQVINVVQGLLDGFWFGQSVPKLNPENIGILYANLAGVLQKENICQQFVDDLQKKTGVPVLWLSNPNDRSARRKITEPSIKVQSIHSAKGLQYAAVILIWFELPAPFATSIELIQTERNLCFVALTRAETFLLISTSRPSPFIAQIESSPYIQIY